MSDSKPVLIDFWAAWCGPCKMMLPIMEELEKEYEGKIEVKKYEVDAPENQDIATKYQVMSIPTFIFEKDGKVVNQLVGAQPKTNITKILDELIK